MRILIIRRDNIGDLVCTTPLFAALRARYREAHIAVLVNSYNAAVLDGNPHLDAVHSYTKLKHRLPGESRLGILFARVQMLARLRREHFDYVVLAKAGFDRQGLSLARQLRRRRIVGFTEPGKPAPASITIPVPGLAYDDLHEVEVMKRLAEAIDVHDAGGPLRVYPVPARMDAWRARLPALGQRDGRLWIAVHISAREPGRRWPIGRWVELIGRLTATGNIGVVLLWAPGAADDPRHPGDDADAAAILTQAGTSALPVPTAELTDLIAALALCDAFIGADGGAMHLAAALGLPTLALFENREDKKRRWYPWQVPYELVAPAKRDIADITVDQVVQGWQRLAPRVASREAAAAI
jgi:ADP-heptose:LPS heptosyltransferase